MYESPFVYYFTYAILTFSVSNFLGASEHFQQLVKEGIIFKKNAKYNFTVKPHRLALLSGESASTSQENHDVEPTQVVSDEVESFSVEKSKRPRDDDSNSDDDDDMERMLILLL